MTAMEVKREVREIRKFAAEIEKSPEKARAFLSKMSMYDKNGRLKPQFQ